MCPLLRFAGLFAAGGRHARRPVKPCVMLPSAPCGVAPLRCLSSGIFRLSVLCISQHGLERASAALRGRCGATHIWDCLSRIYVVCVTACKVIPRPDIPYHCLHEVKERLGGPRSATRRIVRDGSLSWVQVRGVEPRFDENSLLHIRGAAPLAWPLGVSRRPRAGVVLFLSFKELSARDCPVDDHVVNLGLDVEACVADHRPVELSAHAAVFEPRLPYPEVGHRFFLRHPQLAAVDFHCLECCRYWHGRRRFLGVNGG